MRLPVLVLLVVTSITGVMRAQYRNTGFRTFAQLDQNRNGFIEGFEWTISRPSFFSWLDRDGDSKLSPEEYFQTQQDFDRVFRMHLWDRDGDRVIAQQEWRGNIDQFNQLDLNGDGVLTADEYMGVYTGGYTGGRMGRRSREYSRGDYPTYQATEQRFRQWDANGDGVIQGNEWHGRAGDFHWLDRDHDGVLSLDEFLDRSALGLNDTQARRTAAEFRNLDVDGDGYIYGDEWPGDMNLFYSLDRNNDGVLSRSEFLSRR